MNAAARRLTALAALFCLVLACAEEPPPPASGPKLVHLQEDVEPALLYSPPDAAGGPLLLLLGGPGDAPEDWQVLIRRATAQSYHCLLLPPLSVADPDKAYAQAAEVLLAAMARPEAKGRDAALVAAGVAGNCALEFVKRGEWRPEALVFLSPAISYGGRRATEALAAVPHLPIMLNAATGDAHAAASGRALKRAAEGYVELREYGGAAHGADLLAAIPESSEQVLLWLEPILMRSE
jgi:hypothetical protein